MELKFTDARLSQEVNGGEVKQWLSICITDRSAALRFLENMKDKPYVADLKEYREKRSLDANAYLWVLLGKLAARLRSSPEEVYREAIKGIGDNYIIVPVRDDLIDHWREVWQSKGTGWIAEEFLPCKQDGYTYVRNFYGSSTYDTEQMSALLDRIITDCEEQGIDTATPEEIALMKARWE